MATPTLILAGTVSIATALAFLYVGVKIARRPMSIAARPANTTLGLWWGLMGAYLCIQGALTVVAGVDALTLGTYLASRIVIIPLLCGAVASLLHHLVFLYTGRARLATLVALIYVPIGALFAYATFGASQTLHVGAWLVSLDDTSSAYRLTYAFVGLPPFIASFAYLALLGRIDDPLQRMRVWLVSLTIAAYIGSGLAARLAASDEFKFVTLVGFGLAAAGLVLLAYQPPRFVRDLATRRRSA